jgi:ribosomal protein S3
VKQRREPTRVYAVLAPSPETALEAVQTLTADGMEVEITGMLSKHMARSLKLKPGELKLI